MAVIGLGFGMTMQNLVLSVQNAVPMSQLGAASSTVAFFRSLGGAVGVAVLGAVLGHQVSSHIISGLAALGVPAGASGGGGQIPDLATLPAPVAQVVQESYGIGAGDIFLVAAPITFLALVAVLFIKEVPLRTSNDEPEQVLDTGAAALPAASARSAGLDNGAATNGTASNGATPNGYPLNGSTSNGSRSNGAAHNGAVGNGAARNGGRRLLSNRAVLTGTVRAGGGAPVAGAQITVLAPADGEIALVTTDVSGHYRVTLPTGGSFLLVVNGAGHRPAVAAVAVADGIVERDFQLDAVGSLGGLVRDAAGQPRGGVTVTVIDARGDVSAVSVTGPTGRYELADLQPGEYTLTAIVGGSNPAAYGVRIPQHGRADFDIDVPENGSLRGAVRGRESGLPVPNASVAVLDGGGTVIEAVRADEFGRYQIDALSPGEYTVVASGYGPAARRVTVQPVQDQTLDLTLGHDQDDPEIHALPSGRHARIESVEQIESAEQKVGR